MFKKSLAVLFALLFTFSFGTMAFASENDADSAKGLEIIEKANIEIDELIANAVEEGTKLHADYQITAQELALDTTYEGQQKAAAAEADYNAQLDELIIKLQDKAVELTNKGIEEAAAYGVYGQCVWKLVQIADRSVWVDPIQVIGWT
ncbi:hypothetical protein V1498_10210 [Peribacillus sp. SCS-26]|uniref:hypothetical protein n=1 Tax=Paraperibacillus marinus TaxID=3115295 RepID=UPI0039062D2E